jgi:hypothetical protein
MPEGIYTIRKAIIAPLSMAVFSLLFLLLFSFLLKSLPGERFVLTSVCILALYLFFEVLFRRVSLDAGGLEIRKFLRKKKLAWDEVTYLGSVAIGNKAYVLLTTTKGMYILSNNYERFPVLLDHLSRRLSEERVEREIRNLIEHPLKNNGPVRSAWCMVVIVIAVVIFRLYI